MPAPPLPLLLALAQAAPSPSASPAPVSPAPASPAPVSPAPAPADPAVAPAPAPAPAPEPVVYEAPVAPVAPVAPQAPKKPQPEHGPFFADELPPETRFPAGRQPEDPPRLSLGRGKFCFVDDAKCKISLVATADVGLGVNVVRGEDFAFAQFNFRGGLVLKPLTMTKDGGWHPWGIGLAGGWSRATGDPGKEGFGFTPHSDAVRVFLINQLWLSQKRNGFHLDIDFGIVRSPVPTTMGNHIPAFGTHAGVSANWGGWGGLFMSGDFLYQDTRVVFGFRGHGLAAGPAIGLVLLGLLAGGAFR